MDLFMLFWVALMGTAPPAILGYLMYNVGLRRGREEKEQAKTEIKQEISRYVKEELVNDLVEAVSDAVIKGVRGAFGPIGRGGSEETQQYLIEEAKRNPGIVEAFGKIATRGGARWLGKQFGISRGMVDTIVSGGGNPFGMLQSQSKRQKDDPTMSLTGPQVP